MHLVFTRMPGASYHRRLRSLLLYLCYVLWALINSLVCWFCTSTQGHVLFKTCLLLDWERAGMTKTGKDSMKESGKVIFFSQTLVQETRDRSMHKTRHSKSNTVSTTTSISPRPSRTVPCITWFSRNFNTLKKRFQNSRTLQDLFHPISKEFQHLENVFWELQNSPGLCLVSSNFQEISTPGKCVFRTPELSRTVPCFIQFPRNFNTWKMCFQNSRTLKDCALFHLIFKEF